MDENTLAFKVFTLAPAGENRVRPPLLWKYQVEKVLAALGISNWSQIAKRINDWRAIVNSNITA